MIGHSLTRDDIVISPKMGKSKLGVRLCKSAPFLVKVIEVNVCARCSKFSILFTYLTIVFDFLGDSSLEKIRDSFISILWT